MDVEPTDDAAHGAEVPLAGGDVTVGVVRVGDTVRRPRGPWSSSVASYLQHLDQVGFPEAPRYLGIDERDRDILQFIPGDVPSQPVVEPWAAASSVLIGVADLLRRLHEASASFVPPADACWFGDDIYVDMSADVPIEPPPDVISHFDVTPQNVVFRARKPIGLIDFDLTRPGRRLGDVVNTAMWWVPLFLSRIAIPPWERVTCRRGWRRSLTPTGWLTAIGRRSATSRSTALPVRGTGCGPTPDGVAEAGPECGPRDRRPHSAATSMDARRANDA
jgi:hypothetical protein